MFNKLRVKIALLVLRVLRIRMIVRPYDIPNAVYFNRLSVNSKTYYLSMASTSTITFFWPTGFEDGG